MAKTLSKQEFNNIKLLLRAGLSSAKVGEVCGRSGFVLAAVKKTETYEEYVKFVANKNAHRKQQTVVKTVEQVEPSEEKSAESTDIQVRTILENIDARLEAIEISVKWIENHTEVKPRKRLFSNI